MKTKTTSNDEFRLYKFLRFFPAQMWIFLPYGKWTLSDGTEVFFNREYHPIWMRFKSGKVSRCWSHWWVDFKQQAWFYKDSNAPRKNEETLKKCIRLLDRWGVLNETLYIIDNDAAEPFYPEIDANPANRANKHVNFSKISNFSSRAGRK